MQNDPGETNVCLSGLGSKCGSVRRRNAIKSFENQEDVLNTGLEKLNFHSNPKERQ